MTKKLLFLVFIGCGLLTELGWAQNRLEQSRVERLIGLAKVWGTVKYFHPYLGHKEIAWDNALIETIPKVNSARSPEEYAAAIQGLLNHVGDPNTFAEISAGIAKPVPSGEVIRVQNGVYILDGRRVRDLSEAEIPAALADARAVVLDLRGTDYLTASGQESFDWFLNNFLPKILNEQSYTDALRYRVLHGYSPQNDDSAFYGSNYQFVTTARRPLNGRLKKQAPRLIVLVNEKTSGAQVMSSLQSSDRILMLQEGQLEAGIETHKMALPDGVVVRMRQVEVVTAEGQVGFRPDQIIDRSTDGNALLEFAIKQVDVEWRKSKRNPSSIATDFLAKERREAPYAAMEFPSTEYRLLALFRFWNTIEHFFPYKYLLDHPWDKVLPKYIKKFEENKEAADYQWTVGEMTAEMQDSHGDVSGPRRRMDDRSGVYLPPFAAKYLGDKLVVAYVFDKSAGLKVGDTILKIDGRDEKAFTGQFLPFFPASTLQGARRRLGRFSFRGHENTKLELLVGGVDGKQRNVTVTRSMSTNDSRWAEYGPNKRTTPIYEVLPSGYGYVDMNRLESADLERAWELVKNTPGLILDIRGGPRAGAYGLPRKLAFKDAVIFRGSRGYKSARSLGSDWMIEPSLGSEQLLGEPIGPGYSGKVVVLTNEFAQSAAESFCMAVKAVTNATFIGTPTAGTNGGTANTVLPGNLQVVFTVGHVRFPNGEQLQRRGIQPTIRVVPTAKGIGLGKDEVLEAAVKFLNRKKP